MDRPQPTFTLSDFDEIIRYFDDIKRNSPYIPPWARMPKSVYDIMDKAIKAKAMNGASQPEPNQGEPS